MPTSYREGEDPINSKEMLAYLQTNEPGRWGSDPVMLKQYEQIFGPKAAEILKSQGMAQSSIYPEVVGGTNWASPKPTAADLTKQQLATWAPSLDPQWLSSEQGKVWKTKVLADTSTGRNEFLQWVLSGKDANAYYTSGPGAKYVQQSVATDPKTGLQTAVGTTTPPGGTSSILPKQLPGIPPPGGSGVPPPPPPPGSKYVDTGTPPPAGTIASGGASGAASLMDQLRSGDLPLAGLNVRMGGDDESAAGDPSGRGADRGNGSSVGANSMIRDRSVLGTSVPAGQTLMRPEVGKANVIPRNPPVPPNPVTRPDVPLLPPDTKVSDKPLTLEELLAGLNSDDPNAKAKAYGQMARGVMDNPGALTVATLLGQKAPKSWNAPGVGYGTENGRINYFNAAGKPFQQGADAEAYWLNPNDRTQWEKGDLDKKIQTNVKDLPWQSVPWIKDGYEAPGDEHSQYFNDQGKAFGPGDQESYWYSKGDQTWYQGDLKKKVKPTYGLPWM